MPSTKELVVATRFRGRWRFRLAMWSALLVPSARARRRMAKWALHQCRVEVVSPSGRVLHSFRYDLTDDNEIVQI